MAVRRRPAVVALGVVVAAMAMLLGLVVVVGLVLASRIDDADLPPVRGQGDGIVEADVEPDTPAPQPAALAADVDLDVWAEGVAEAHDLPPRVVRAYGAAELTLHAREPECRLSWATLAGIGRVESHHGQIGPAEVDADGVARPSIIGIPLDGTGGTRWMPDSDGGELDGDLELDRAVGPMQFLPTTWQRYGADGNGDGVNDPQQIDDAALAAGNYLCAGGRDTGTGPGWWAGVLTYNNSTSYGRLVWAAVERYAAPPPSPDR
ncbi:lytic transglycosylase domain-containing protein [Pseudonocardia lacus]|uniref:lytic transglycosylase domain-containing protein n=1 Tax=Pseudonocardia lacus TaxID=2835865 RepID=UPI0027E34BF2|nr:lytic murein transglycosylase [Pseudonocardia lacus]